MKMITAQGLKSEMEKPEKPFTLVDVRDAAAYQEKHIPRAVNVPSVADFGTALDCCVAAKDAVVVLYAEHEEYDAEVEKFGTQAEAAGYAEVYGLAGGLMKWMEAGGTVDFGTES